MMMPFMGIIIFFLYADYNTPGLQYLLRREFTSDFGRQRWIV